MKKIIIPISALLISGLAHAQTTPSSTENYIYTKTYLSDPTVGTPKTSETIQYFDGLGRAKQVVNVKASPTGKDVVSHIEYDQFGRQVKDYLPVPQSGTQNGAIYASPLGNASSIYGSEKIYAEKVLENSPLDRIQQQIQVGNDWTGKPVKFDYDANTIADQVKKFTTSTIWENGATKSTPAEDSFFTDGKLYKNSVKDEDGNQTIEFKNGKGQVLLVRKVIASDQYADTYYIYNEYEQLAFVIPPLATSLNQTSLDNLCYQYRYDGKSRLVEKKLPGKGWEYMLYDLQDRLVATQDANLRAKGQWLYTKYDKFGRVAITGISTGSTLRVSEQNEVDGIFPNNVNRINTVLFNRQGMDVYYDTPDSTYPNSTKWVSLLSLNYYDTYPAYGFNPSFPNTIYGKQVLTDNSTGNNISTKSLPVMSLVKNIEDDNWTKNYTYYDTKGRVISTYSINHLGGDTKTESDLDFIGVPLQTKTYHKRLSTDTERIITETFTYDNQNRLLTHKHQVDNNTEEILAQNTYNELSQLSNKKVGNNLQSIDYSYNIRGWMTKINDPANLNGKLFGYEMKYTNPTYNTVSSGKFNGNISEIDWATSNNGTLKRYNYQYDALNRLKNGIYSEPNTSLPQNGYYNETLNYDLNGNILNLQRNRFLSGIGVQLMDNLSYSYTGNKLNAVTDATGSFGGYPESSGNLINYDLNGNMTDHIDKGVLQISYNYLNLPDYIKFDQTYIPRLPGVDENVNTQYLYRADGVKLKKVYTYGSGRAQTEVNRVTEYLDGFQYEGEHTSKNFDTALRFVPTAEGYYNFENNKYIYNYTDHLGNIRLSYLNNGLGAEIIEENNYYPFGLKHGTGGITGNPVYRYQYNGKELQEETGMYDYGARFYMPDIGRWGVIDPLAEKMTRHSPYNYAFNNPLRFIDPDGRQGKDWVKNGNEVFYDPQIQSQKQAMDKYGENAIHMGEGSTLTTKINGVETTTYTFHNNGTVSSNLGTLDNRFDHTTEGGTTIIAASNPVGGYGVRNYEAGLAATAIEKGSGVSRIGSNYKLYTATQTGRVFYGNQYVKTYGIAKIGKGLGVMGFGAGLAMDTYGLAQYMENPSSPEAVTPAKFSTNTGMGAWGLLGGPYGVIVSAAYGGMEAFYPGGLEGAVNDNVKYQSELDNGVNKVGPNRVYIIPRGPK